ncbi:L-threonine ammonia-lyase-like [Glandiceps talaboti]
MSVDLDRYRDCITETYSRIKNDIRKTSLEKSPVLSERTGAMVYLKLESEQLTGAAKLRGAFNKLSKLSENHNGTLEVIAASSGNYGLALASISERFDVKITVCVPTYISQAKEAVLQRYQRINVIKYGGNGFDSEVKAKAIAKESGIEYMSPCNDFDVICGQGTIGMEIFADLPNVDVVFVPVGGGGLISGIATYLKSVKPSVQIVGVQPERNHIMEMSVKAGKILDIEGEDTISDSTAGGVDEGSMTFDICKLYVDEWVLVSEEDISKGVYFMMEHHHKIIETAAALPIAALLKTSDKYKNQNVVLMISGSNIAMSLVKDIINKHYTS